MTSSHSKFRASQAHKAKMMGLSSKGSGQSGVGAGPQPTPANPSVPQPSTRPGKVMGNPVPGHFGGKGGM